MLIKMLSDVTTEKERCDLKNVRWGRVSERGAPGFSQRGAITGMWRLGCALTTRNILREGESVWIRARDEFGAIVLSLVGTVTWSDHVFRMDGYRCEVRFRELVPEGIS